MEDIKDLKEVLVSGAKLSKLICALSDGLGLDDIDEAVAFAVSLPAAVEGIQNVPAEIEDLDDSERAEISALLDEFGIPEGKKGEAYKHFVFAGLHAGQGALLLKNAV